MRAPASPSSPALVEEVVYFDGHPQVLSSVGRLLFSVLTLGLGWVYFWIASLTVHYRITSQRVVLERGLFSKRTEQLDLYRIVDYAVDRPIGQRLMRTGNLILHTNDRTSPTVAILGVKTDVSALYETLRRATEAEKRRRGVRVVDAEHDDHGGQDFL